MTLVLLQLGERNPKPDIEKEQVLIEGKKESTFEALLNW